MAYRLTAPAGYPVVIESKKRRDALLARGYTEVAPEPTPEPAPAPKKTTKRTAKILPAPAPEASDTDK